MINKTETSVGSRVRLGVEFGTVMKTDGVNVCWVLFDNPELVASVGWSGFNGWAPCSPGAWVDGVFLTDRVELA